MKRNQYPGDWIRVLIILFVFKKSKLNTSNRSIRSNYSHSNFQ
uniref:Uncharacterized protein n=1 Tax=Lepeophtheirus salmonis TaxID=72036 RepID=A0A0K2VLT9_LEPSM